MVQPIFDYCSISWYGRFNDDIAKLNVLQKRCARIILGVNIYTSSDFTFNVLGWERLQTRNNYFKALMMYKSLNGRTPEYLSNKFNYISRTHGVNTRQAAGGQLALPPWSNQARRNEFSIGAASQGKWFTIHQSGASAASGASNGVGSRGPLKGPWRGPGAEPRRGPGGSAPGSSWVLAFIKGPERLSWKSFFFFFFFFF